MVALNIQKYVLNLIKIDNYITYVSKLIFFPNITTVCSVSILINNVKKSYMCIVDIVNTTLHFIISCNFSFSGTKYLIAYQPLSI